MGLDIPLILAGRQRRYTHAIHGSGGHFCFLSGCGVEASADSADLG
jgi:hypothetical protein